jgi:hypothetical protein
MQLVPVEHGFQGRIPQTKLAGDAKVAVTLQDLLNLCTIHCQMSCHRFFSHIQHVCQDLLILLQEATAAVVAKNTEEDVLIVCQMCNILDEFYVGLFRALARSIFCPTPQNDFSYFV